MAVGARVWVVVAVGWGRGNGVAVSSAMAWVAAVAVGAGGGGADDGSTRFTEQADKLTNTKPLNQYLRRLFIRGVRCSLFSMDRFLVGTPSSITVLQRSQSGKVCSLERNQLAGGQGDPVSWPGRR
jgi:hypothetical protein